MALSLKQHIVIWWIGVSMWLKWMWKIEYLLYNKEGFDLPTCNLKPAYRWYMIFINFVQNDAWLWFLYKIYWKTAKIGIYFIVFTFFCQFDPVRYFRCTFWADRRRKCPENKFSVKSSGKIHASTCFRALPTVFYWNPIARSDWNALSPQNQWKKHFRRIIFFFRFSHVIWLGPLVAITGLWPLLHKIISWNLRNSFVLYCCMQKYNIVLTDKPKPFLKVELLQLPEAAYAGLHAWG